VKKTFHCRFREKLEQLGDVKGGGNLVTAFQGITLPRISKEVHTRQEEWNTGMMESWKNGETKTDRIYRINMIKSGFILSIEETILKILLILSNLSLRF
jgi:hypothetical protein